MSSGQRTIQISDGVTHIVPLDLNGAQTRRVQLAVGRARLFISLFKLRNGAAYSRPRRSK